MRCGSVIARLVAVLLLPAVSIAEEVLFEGGEFDFEGGFRMHRPGLFADRDWDEVGNGWGYWGRAALFRAPEDRYGHPSFNRNRFPPNVHAGRFSQEITMTSANGDAIVWKTFHVPPGHRIRCELAAITTPSEDPLRLRHAIGLGEAIRFAERAAGPGAALNWETWDRAATEGKFGIAAVRTVADGETLTYYLWARHAWATGTGATLCIDNLRVIDEGLAGEEKSSHGDAAPAERHPPLPTNDKEPRTVP